MNNSYDELDRDELISLAYTRGETLKELRALVREYLSYKSTDGKIERRALREQLAEAVKE